MTVIEKPTQPGPLGRLIAKRRVHPDEAVPGRRKPITPQPITCGNIPRPAPRSGNVQIKRLAQRVEDIPRRIPVVALSMCFMHYECIACFGKFAIFFLERGGPGATPAFGLSPANWRALTELP